MLSSPLPPSPSLSVQRHLSSFASVLVVLQNGGAATAQVATLPHVATLISDFLDHRLPQFWSLPHRSIVCNMDKLVTRLNSKKRSDSLYSRVIVRT